MSHSPASEGDIIAHIFAMSVVFAGKLLFAPCHLFYSSAAPNAWHVTITRPGTTTEREWLSAAGVTAGVTDKLCVEPGTYAFRLSERTGT